MAAGRSDVFVQYHIPEFLSGLFAEILDKEIDYALFEPQLDGNILTEDNLAFEHVVVGKYQFDARHEVLKFLIVGKGSQGVNWLRIANEVRYGFFGKLAVAGNFENHFALYLRKMLVGLRKLNQDVKLLFCNDIHAKR